MEEYGEVRNSDGNLVIPVNLSEQFAEELNKFKNTYRAINEYIISNPESANYHPVQLGLYEGYNTLYTLASCDYGLSYDNSYEAQIAYYTEAIAKNPSWIFAGIYADEGISGTMTKKRKNFLRLMDDCEKGKIDMILTKSISRFARNTVDSLSWVRKLRAMNIGVYFEEQAIDSLKAENEMLIGLFSVIAQSESENISANVRWGVQQRMKNGTFRSNFTCFGYRKGENGIPEIVPEEAEIIRDIYDRYLDGFSSCQIRDYLQKKGVTSFNGGTNWHRHTIEKILKNEKYVGDLLLQKTFIRDPISKKEIRNDGQMPKYLVSNNHPAIIERAKFNAVQMEFARRGSQHKKSSKAKTEQGTYCGRYALTELLFCGECGCHYKRTCKKKPNGESVFYWRCINRRENGVDACSAPGVEEKQLHAAICSCLNKLFTKRDETMRLLQGNLQAVVSGENGSNDVYLLERQILSLQEESESLMTMMGTTGGDTEKYMIAIEENFKKVKDLRDQLEIAKCQQGHGSEIGIEMKRFMEVFQQEQIGFSHFDDVVIRRLVECIRVMKDKKIVVVLKGGLQAEEYV